MNPANFERMITPNFGHEFRSNWFKTHEEAFFKNAGYEMKVQTKSSGDSFWSSLKSLQK